MFNPTHISEINVGDTVSLPPNYPDGDYRVTNWTQRSNGDVLLSVRSLPGQGMMHAETIIFDNDASLYVSRTKAQEDKDRAAYREIIGDAEDTTRQNDAERVYLGG